MTQLRILYAFNKRGFEAEYWQRELPAASDDRYTFIPFNYEAYLESTLYVRAQQLDNLYFARHPGLLRMYEDVRAMIGDLKIDVLFVDNSMPFHPEFLLKLNVFKVLRTTDGPLAAYDRDFAYAHAYDQILHHSPAYSADLDMGEKLRYVGCKDARFWPHAVFDQLFDTTKTEENILAGERDIDILFVGHPYPNKMPLLAKVKKAFGRRAVIRGRSSFKWNAYYNVRHGFPGWMRPIAFEEYVPYYQRTKIGFNVHNRGDYTVGSYRLFELPANGVMEISDGGRFLDSFLKTGEEIVGYHGADELIDKIRYYLDHDDERRAIALAGYKRVMRDHRIAKRMRQAGEMIEDGMRLKRERDGVLSAAAHSS